MSFGQRRDEGMDLDEFLDNHTEGLRGELMDAFRKLHAAIEPAVESMHSGEDPLEDIEEAILRTEQVEHVLMEARAIERLRLALAEAEDG